MYERYYYGNDYKFNPKKCDSDEPFENVLVILYMATFEADADMGGDYNDGWMIVYPQKEKEKEGAYWYTINDYTARCFK